MGGATEVRLPACFRRLPGAVLLLSPDGLVVDSNGVLEGELDRPLRGRPFSDALDPGSTGRKWERVLDLASREGEGGDVVWELVLRGRDTLAEPRPFSVLWDGDARAFWLMEHRPDPRLDDLRERVTGVNSELANTQRELLKERGRLASALGSLEEQYAKTDRLARTVQEQNAELERSNRALDEFAYVVSHDLKAPLRAIGNYASWLEEDFAGRLSDETREHLERLRTGVARMGALIQGVLEYARAGRERARPEAVEVGAMLREIVEMLDPPESFTIELGPAMPTLLAERAPLQQVLLNLIGNAIRHTRRDDGRVRVSVEDAGEFHEFSVADNGAGVPPGAHEKIWTLFYTLSSGDAAEGTGIGLAVVRKLVEAQGGRAWAESTPGAGATFRFLWPKRPTARAPRSPDSTP